MPSDKARCRRAFSLISLNKPTKPVGRFYESLRDEPTKVRRAAPNLGLLGQNIADLLHTSQGLLANRDLYVVRILNEE